MFRDRTDAGNLLAHRLLHLKSDHPVVLALPRGGVAVAAPVAASLGAPLDILFVRKIGAPMQPELAIGAIVDGDEPIVVLNDEIVTLLGLTPAQLARAREVALEEIAVRRKQFGGVGRRVSWRGRTIIVIDDGIATGATVRAALTALRRDGAARLILAVPVAPRESLDELAVAVDEIVCLETPEPFHAVGAHYRNFDQVSDADVLALLRNAGRTGAAN